MSQSAETDQPQPLPPRARLAQAAGLLALAFDESGDQGDDALEMLEYHAGSQIGRYLLVKRLGEGGFGIVWQAEQSQPIRREVALKIIRPGMDTRAVVARFRTEQKALERMDHPNIATVLDAGATEQGRPYFVMELVRGRAITHYCEEKGLGLRARLELFNDVCRAVQHAHQKAVLHRDLKPSNILVTERDGRPMPKIIDFGIAKALTDDADGLASLAYTAQGMVLGTPQYMAPEQAMLGAEDMDIRVDVYSLGAILYELLTGSPPMTLDRGSRTSVDKLLRRIHEEEAEPPSARVLHSLDRDKAMPQLASQLKGDLDWITLKALEKDPERRYSSAALLAEEVGRYLNHEPVQAGPPNTWYRLGKLVRRHRPAFISSLVIALSLIVATVVSTYAFVQQSRARARAEVSEHLAEMESQKAQAVVNFLSEMLAQAGSLVDQGKNPEALRLALDQSVERLDALKSQPELEAQLCDKLATVYATMGDQGRALPLYYRQVASLISVAGPNDPRVLRAQLNCVYGEADQANKTRALTLCEEIIRRWEGRGERGTGDWFEAACRHAIILGRMGRNREALAEIQPLMEIHNARGHLGKDDTGLLRRVSEMQSAEGDFAAAEATLQSCLKLLPKNTERQLQSRQSTLLCLARLEAQQKKHAASIKYFEEAISLTVQMAGPKHHPLIEIWIDAARQYADDHRFDDAFHAVDQAVTIARVNGTDEKLPHALRACAEIYQQGGRLDEAITAWRECIGAERSYKARAGLWVYDHEQVLKLLVKAARTDEAERDARALWEETQMQDSTWTDDHFVIGICKTLIDICSRWQAGHHSTAHAADIALWTAKIQELEAKQKRGGKSVT